MESVCLFFISSKFIYEKKTKKKNVDFYFREK